MLLTESGNNNKQMGVAIYKQNMTDMRRQKIMCHVAGDTSCLEPLRLFIYAMSLTEIIILVYYLYSGKGLFSIQLAKLIINNNKKSHIQQGIPPI